MKVKSVEGYRGIGLETLEKFGVTVWSDVTAESSLGSFRGIILPRSETSDEKHIVLKLKSGYNVGIAAEAITSLVGHGIRKAKYKIPEKEFPTEPGQPNIGLFLAWLRITSSALMR